MLVNNNSLSLSTSDTLYIGRFINGSSPLNAYMRDFQIFKGGYYNYDSTLTNCLYTLGTNTYYDISILPITSQTITCLDCNSTTAVNIDFTNSQRATCISSCPATTFRAVSTNQNICTTCSITCSTCSTSTPSLCNSCLSTMYYLLSNQSCYSTCPSHYWANSSTIPYVCISCDSTCQECIGSLPTQCINCNTVYGNSTSYFYQNQCLATCPIGTYADISKLCQNCNNMCYTCNGGLATNCLTCNTTGTNKYFMNGNKTCTSACPTNGYYADASYTCQSCDSTCYTCNGTTINNCLTCNITGTYKYFMNGNKTCMSACPTGYYADASYICQSCDSTCYTCNGANATNCLTCNTTGTYKYLMNTNNTCMLACPPGYYANGSYICQFCNSTCYT